MTSANRLAECVKPVVEHLETRTMMSITVKPLETDSESNIRLVITGDSKNDTLLITDDPVAQEVRLVKNGVPQTIAYPGGSPIALFDVDLGGGNDKIFFDTYGDAISFNYTGETRSIHLDGNSGNDTIELTIPGGIIAGSEVAVDIDGDSGNDNITLNFNYLRDSVLDIDLKDGEGNDTSLVNLPNQLSSDGAYSPNYNSTVFFDADTGNGKNTLTVNAAASVYYDSLLDIDIKGGNGDDKISTSLTGPIDVAPGGQLVLNIDGQNNNDTIATNLNFADKIGGGGGQLTMQIMGGQNTDKITLIATDLSTSGILFGPGANGAVLDGQSGTDKVFTNLTNFLTTPLIRNFEQTLLFP